MSQRDEFRGGELERGREPNGERDGRDAESPPVTNEWEAARGYGSGEGRYSEGRYGEGHYGGEGRYVGERRYGEGRYGREAGASQPNYGPRGSQGYWRERSSWQRDPYGFSQRSHSSDPSQHRYPYADPSQRQPPYQQDFRTRYREMPSRGGFPRDQYGREHSRDQLFGQREPFRRDDDLHYYGTGSPGGWGNPGPGFTGGAHGYDDNSRYPEHSLQGEYSDESAMSYENQSRRDYRSAAPRYPRGPKGYQRSDERLKEDISERLMEAYHIDSSEVTVEVRGAKVSLEGTVPSRHMKHAIEDMVDRCPGVLDIDNRIRVAGPNYQGSAPMTSQSQAQSNPTTLSPGSKSKQ